MQLLYKLIRGTTRLNEVIGRWMSYLIFLITAAMLLGVLFRYVFNLPLAWSTELTQLLFGLYAVMSGGYVLAHKQHVNVDLFYSGLSRRAQAILDVMTSVLFFLFIGVLLYFTTSMAFDSIALMETSNSAWNPPIYPFKVAIPIAIFLVLLQGIAKLIEDLAIAFGMPDQAFSVIKVEDL